MGAFLILWLGFAIAVAILANRFDRSGILWFLIALVISPLLAGIIVLAMGRNGKRCPSCAETVKREAATCRHCGHNFQQVQQT